MQDSGTHSAGIAQWVVLRRGDGRRVFSDGHKEAIVRQCLEPGVSVAGVALAHGINANLVRRWIGKRARSGGPRVANAALVPVRIAAPVAAPVAPLHTAHLEIALRGARISVSGAVDAVLLRAVVQVLTDVLPA